MRIAIDWIHYHAEASFCNQFPALFYTVSELYMLSFIKELWLLLLACTKNNCPRKKCYLCLMKTKLFLFRSSNHHSTSVCRTMDSKCYKKYQTYMCGGCKPWGNNCLEEFIGNPYWRWRYSHFPKCDRLWYWTLYMRCSKWSRFCQSHSSTWRYK